MMTAAAPEIRSETEAILLSGFLGSGKTTLLRHLLALTEDLSDTVVIMNEFGEISIDGMLVDRDVEMVELVNGCICCTLQLDLKKQIETLVRDFHPRRMIMEATGLADTGALLDVFADYTEQGVLSSYKMVAVIDGQVWPMRHILGPVFDRQLACAGLILFNKIDTLDPATIAAYTAEVEAEYPGAVVVPTRFCDVDTNLVRAKAGMIPGPGAAKNKGLSFHLHSGGWTSLSFVESAPMDEQKFKTFLDRHHREIFRLKGSVRFPDRTRIINYVNGRGDWADSGQIRETRLVVIGRSAGLGLIRGELTGCLVH